MSDHDFFLKIALEEAFKQRGYCAPHPCVGAVAVVDGQMVAKAFHQGPGRAHAEVEVLSQLPHHLDNLTLYVTLEPCNHWGKTPPCVKAIIDYGVKEVIFAYRDPHVHVPGNDTCELLSAHGIHVEHHPVPEIDAFYQSYHHWVTHQKPYVVAKWAQSFDGKVGFSHRPYQLTNHLANEFTHQSRHLSDVILTTSQTILCDNPKLNVRLTNHEFAKPIAVLDSRLRLTGNEQFFSCAKQVHVFHQAGVKPKYVHQHVSFHEIELDKGGKLNLNAILCCLGKLGFHDVWLEAGPQFMQAMHQQKLVHQTHILLAPIVLGEQALSAYPIDCDYFSSPFSLHSKQLGDNMLTTFIWQDN